MPTPTASPAKRVAKGSLARERILQTALHELEQFDQRLGLESGKSRAASRTPPSAAGTVKLPAISPSERRALSASDPSPGHENASSPSPRAPGAGSPKVAPSAHEIKAFLAIRGPLDPAQHLALLESEFQLAPAVQVLDDEEFLNYLQGEGSWAYRQDPPKANHVLGKIVSHILSYSLDSENRPVQDPLPPLSLKLCIMGKQFSGKQTIAEQIGRLFDVSIIRADRLVHRAIQIARESASLGVTDGVLLDLGRRAQECLLAGADVDDAVLVGLVAYRIRQIAEQDAAAGWILVGFPRTRAQAQLLEKELTGYEEPKPVKPGNIKRSASPSAGASAALSNGGGGAGGGGGGVSATATRNSAGDSANTSLRPNSGSPSAKDPTKRRSLITPDGAPAEATKTPTGSGLDLAILLQIPNDAAFRRATGRCVDPVKQQVYHLDFNPPPSDQVGLNTRLVPGDNVAQSQMHLRIAAFEEEEPSLIEWFSRFGNLTVIDSNVPLEACTAQIEKLLSEIKAKKSKGPDSLSSSTASDPTKAPSSADKDRPKDAKDPKPVGPEDKVKSRGSSAAKSRSSSARKSHNELAKPATPPAPTIVEAPAPPAPPPQKETRKEPSPRLLQVLSDEWAVLETVFTNTTKYLFRSLRRERETLINYFYEVKRHFEKFVTRPDSKQDLLRAFQEEFNALDDDLRGDPDAKAELHQRTEDLRDKLWGISDERKEQAETERTAIIMSHFVEDHYLIVTECYIGLMQAEMDRFLGTTHIVLDYVKDTQQQLINEGGPRTCPLPRPGSMPATGKEENLLKLTPSMLNIKREQSASKIKLSVAAVEKSAAKRQAASTAGILPGGGAATAAGSVAVPAIGGRSEDTPDHVLFSDLYRAAEVAIALINGLEDDERRTHRDTGKGGKGAGGAAGGVPTATGAGVNVAASANKTNPNSPVPVGATGMGSSNTGTAGAGEGEAGEMNPEHTQALRNEEFLTRARVLRILEVGCEHLREIRTRAFEVFSFLDECIGSSFKGEMGAIKDMVTVAKQAIELELRLPNALVINGQQFLVDYGALTFDAELQPRPVSPVETAYADKFTIQQLKQTWVAHFRVIAKDGFLTGAGTLLISCAARRRFPNVYDYLPDVLVGYPESYAKIAQALDPHDTGFVSWRKFIVFAALVLPAPMNHIHELHAALAHRPDGLVTHDEFMAMRLWFETEDLTASQRLFNRSVKTKQLFFGTLHRARGTTARF
ncbi:hypothetical protein AMAG_05837 [Allomyces macrogynus ATCC 38327]|uniref:SPEF2 C-terminal domain-containing protein n=1 Tax=Allomyces macrogynus (strain ATCC 38327) TaxID=578462 RepID=A0A0L0SDE0_ALLM3|nr:hypothetical protein AMAG_05837 [Allomyces macrogynus ATCC 38327]|eukprot:KNE60449.1 hypothetical protein AMAG_05837 [Allomyces macrogynus ATCC 38327]